MTRTRFIGVDYDPLTLDDLLEQFGQRPAEARFAYLVTPNVDHVVRCTIRCPMAMRSGPPIAGRNGACATAASLPPSPDSRGSPCRSRPAAT